MSKEIADNVTLVNTAGNNLGLIFFYYADEKKVMFENQGVNPDFDFKKIPVLAGGVDMNYHGPHKSTELKAEYSVFSILRKISLIDMGEFYVYIETDNKLFNEILSYQRYNLNVSHILLNDAGKIIYSQNESVFPAGTGIDVGKLNSGRKSDKIRNGYYVFSEKGAQGWYLIAAISRKDYNYEIYKWGVGFIIFAFLSIFGSLLLARSIWRTVYRPIKSLNAEIGLMAESRFDSQIRFTGINEFDKLLERFQDMRSKIVYLFGEIEEKEKKKKAAEVEILLHQINPHFLHNTLNTIQWLARMNGQDEIDRLVALFTRVLHYNLGKEGGTVALSEEISALKDYVELQRIRFDYQFEVKIDVEEAVADIKNTQVYHTADC